MTLLESCRLNVELIEKIREMATALDGALRERAIAVDALREANTVNAGLVQRIRALERRQERTAAA
jgi:hypothetical protein